MNRADINKRLRRTNIKGKDYIEVNQRILAFWELYPNGRITTELLADDGKRCTFKASVYDGDNLLATGHSFEFQGAGMINKTSYVENCETSAVGRALGMLGIGVTESIASADEVQAAIEHQERNEEPQDELQAAQNELVAAEKQYCSVYGIDDWGEFHRNVIMKRGDYANDAAVLKNIATELRYAS